MNEGKLRFRNGPRRVLLGLLILVPLNMGGCAEFQDSAVSAIETAVRSILDAAVTLYFDQFRPDSV